MLQPMSKAPHCSVPVVNQLDMEHVENNSKEYTYCSLYGMSIVTVYSVVGAGAVMVIHPEDRKLTFNSEYKAEAFAYARRLKEQYKSLRG